MDPEWYCLSISGAQSLVSFCMLQNRAMYSFNYKGYQDTCRIKNTEHTEKLHTFFNYSANKENRKKKRWNKE